MQHRIEMSPSARAGCRGCKAKIEKGVLRFAEEFQSTFSEEGTSFRYWHLGCAAKKLPNEVSALLGTFEGDVPDKAAIEATIAEAAKKGGKGVNAPLPHADHAPTGRAKCMHCREAIAKGALRVGVERELETGNMTTQGAGYLHPKCVFAYANSRDEGTPEELAQQVLENSAHLEEAARDALIKEFDEGASAGASAS
jgi:hypothetical protein